MQLINCDNSFPNFSLVVRPQGVERLPLCTWQSPFSTAEQIQESKDTTYTHATVYQMEQQTIESLKVEKLHEIVQELSAQEEVFFWEWATAEGCFFRADLIYTCLKCYGVAKGELSKFFLLNHLDPFVVDDSRISKWTFHVAVIVKVKNQGEHEEFVIDPLVSKIHAVTLEEWLNMAGNNKPVLPATPIYLGSSEIENSIRKDCGYFCKTEYSLNNLFYTEQIPQLSYLKTAAEVSLLQLEGESIFESKETSDIKNKLSFSIFVPTSPELQEMQMRVFLEEKDKWIKRKKSSQRIGESSCIIL